MAASAASVPEIIGDNIRRARKGKNWTQRELAEAVGAWSNQVAVWERGEARPNDENLMALAAALDLTVADLFQQAPPNGSAP